MEEKVLKFKELVEKSKLNTSQQRLVESILATPSNFGRYKKDLQTPEICGLAVSLRGANIKHVKEEFLTQELADIAMSLDAEALLTVMNTTFLTKENLLNAMRIDGKFIEAVPSHRLEKEVVLAAVQSSDDALRLLDKRGSSFTKDLDVITEAVKLKGTYLNMVKRSEQTEEMVYNAVVHGKACLGYVASEFKTDNIIYFAVKENGLNIQYVPKKQMSDELSLMAVRGTGEALEYIDSPSDEMCLEAVKNKGSMLEKIPDYRKTYEMCLEAVKNDGSALKYVPHKFLTEELCLIAFNSSGSKYSIYLRNVPQELRTDAVVEAALKHNGANIEYVSNPKPEWLMMAVEENGYVLKYIQDKMKTNELCKRAVENRADAIKYVPEVMKTKEICDISMAHGYMSVVKHIPEAFISKDLALKVAESYCFEDLPVGVMTEEVALKAVSYDSAHIRYIPADLQTEDVCLIAIQQDVNNLQYIKNQTFELCMKAYEINPSAERYFNL